jgi:hypothetical protein
MPNSNADNIDRTPIAHNIVYAVQGAPEIAEEHCATRTIAPTQITLTYRFTTDSNSADGSWMNCHCDVADDMLKRADAAQKEN